MPHEKQERLRNAASILQRGGEVGEALAQLCPDGENPGSAAAMQEDVAAFCLKLGRYNDALGIYESLADRGYQSVSSLNNLAFLLLRSQQFDAAIQRLEQALALEQPEDSRQQIRQNIERTRQIIQAQAEVRRRDEIFDQYVNDVIGLLRDTGTPPFTPFHDSGSRGCAVIVECRQHPWLEHALRNMAFFLPDGWSALVVHGRDNAGFVDDLLEACGLRGVVGLQRLETGNLDRVQYSDLLKKPGFWDMIPARQALIFQVDAMLLRPGIEAFTHWDYIGAPWTDRHVPQGVGNGGLSLRTVKVMRDIASRFAADSPQSEMEDVFFATRLHRHGRELGATGGLASREAAHRFSAENRLNDLPTATAPLGIHQAWRFHSDAEVEHWLDAARRHYRAGRRHAV